MPCIRPSNCYARQKFGSSMSAGSFIALISQSNAVGSRKKWTSVTFLTRSSQASFTRSQSSSTSLFRHANIRESCGAVLYSCECNFFDSQINYNRPPPPPPSSGLQLQYQTFFVFFTIPRLLEKLVTALKRNRHPSHCWHTGKREGQGVGGELPGRWAVTLRNVERLLYVRHATLS